MKKNIIKNLIILVFSLAVPATSYQLLATRISAQDFSLGVYPPIMQIQADAPTSIKKEFTVVNASNNPQDTTIVLRAFTSSPYNSGQVSYLPLSQKPTPDADIFEKIQVLDGDDPITTITLAPKQKKTLTLRIGLPKDEPPADYYFSLLFVSNDSVQKSASGSQITAGIAINVLLSIGPVGPTEGFLEEFSTPWFLQTGPVPFTVSIHNESTHYITPKGQILIRNMFGQLVGKVDLLPVNILAGSTRYIPSSNASLSSSASLTVNSIEGSHPTANWNEKVLFGPYSANIVTSLSTEGPLFSRTIYFFAMPWEYLVGAGIAIVIMWIVVERVRKRIKS